MRGRQQYPTVPVRRQVLVLARLHPARAQTPLCARSKGGRGTRRLVAHLHDGVGIIVADAQLERQLRVLDHAAVSEAIEVVRPSAAARNVSLLFERPTEPRVLIGAS